MTGRRLCIVGLCVLVTAMSVRGAEAPRVAGVWHFDEGEGVLALNAVPEGDPIRVHGAAYVPGKFGRALRFDGVDDYAEGVSVDLPQGSLEFWIRTGRTETQAANAQAREDWMPYLGLGSGYRREGEGWEVVFCPYRGTRGFSFVMFSDSHRRRRWLFAGGPLKPDTWQHVLFTWGGNGLALYLDGRLADRAPDETGPLRFDLLIGANAWGKHGALAIDELRLYRVALPLETAVEHFTNAAYVADPPQPKPDIALGPRAEIDLRKYYDPESPTCGIQDAIDALPEAGGLVRIPAGVYRMRRAIRLRSRLTLAGAGPATVLRMPPAPVSRLLQDAAAGDTAIRVADPRVFRVGSEVAVYDERMHGWYCTHEVVEAVEGQTIRLSGPIRRTCRTSRQAEASGLFPMIRGRNVRDFVIRGLRIEGQAGNQPGVTDFTLSAIHFREADHGQIFNCVVKDWPSDGFSLQRCRDVQVSNCQALYCRGHGFHPGSTSWRLTFTNNIARGNTWDGFYFCMNVHYSVVSGNVFAENGWNGIGGIGGGGDVFNVVSNNVCEGNGRAGIVAVHGKDHVIANNICLNNSRSDPGKYPGIQLSHTTHTLVTGNRCADEQTAPTQHDGIVESGESDYNVITNNMCAGLKGKGVVVVGEHTVNGSPRSGEMKTAQ